MDFVTVKTSHYVADLVVLKSRLESEGIECRLKNELTTQLINYIPSFLVELQVPWSALPRVKEVMVETGETEAGNEVVCPECGSDLIDLSLPIGGRIRLLFNVIKSALLLRKLPPDAVQKDVRHECRACGAKF